MLTGRPGIGGFLWQEYNAGISEHIILSIVTIGLVGFLLDRLMNLAEKHVHALLNIPSQIRRFFEWLHSAPAERTVAHVIS
jgi:hypothetical protein